MFFGNSRISFVKNLTTLLGGLADNNYVVIFIDEAVTDYSNNDGTVVGTSWNDDFDDFRLIMEGKNINSFVVFDIDTNTANPSDYIWAENSDATLPFPEQNMVKIFRPNSESQQEFYQTVLANLESRWGNDVWGHMSSNDLKLIMVVDVSGSMRLSLIQEALNSLTTFLNERNVENYVLSGCQNERWLAWAAAAYHDAEDAGCSGTCNWGKLCSYICDDPGSDCHGSVYNTCIPAFTFLGGDIIHNPCPPCSDLPVCPSETQEGEPGLLPCTTCLEPVDCCRGCTLPTYCDTCGPSGKQYFHRCVKCHYLASDQLFDENPIFVYGSLSACGIANCSCSAGTTFGATSWNDNSQSWSWINTVPGLSGPTLFGNICRPSFKDAFGNCGVCPITHPTDEGSIIWMVELCDAGCTNCGSINDLPRMGPNGATTIDSSRYNVCLFC